jgi:hypothetical protein
VSLLLPGIISHGPSWCRRNTSKLGDYALEDCETAKGETHATGAGQRWYTSRVSMRGLRGVSVPNGLRPAELCG